MDNIHKVCVCVCACRKNDNSGTGHLGTRYIWPLYTGLEKTCMQNELTVIIISCQEKGEFVMNVDYN